MMACTAFAAATAAQTTPQAQVEDFNRTLLYVMKNAQSLGYAGRRDALAPKLNALYHLPAMARIAVGQHWRTLSPQQQAKLVDAFTRLTVATYANRFNGWSGEKIEMRGTKDVRAKTILVQTAIVRPGDEDVAINYLMRQFSTGWRVIDVYLKESYSEMATKRSEYTSIISRQGFDALIREIEAKIVLYERA